MKIDSFTLDLPTLPIARRERASALAKLPNLGDYSKYFAPAMQRSLVGSSRPTGVSDTTKRVLENGVKVVEKIKENGPDVPLSDDEAAAFESVILVYDRPALLVQNDQCATTSTEYWTDPLRAADKAITERLPKVGRIEIMIGDTVREIATGFVVGDSLVMTNRHVLEVIADADLTDPTVWKLRSRLRPQINFKAEYLVNDDSHIFPLDAGSTARTHPQFDLALVKIRNVSTKAPPLSAPPRLRLTQTRDVTKYDIEKNRNIYIVGYPAADNQNKIPKAVLDDIFGGIFEVKRLAPGWIATNWSEKGLFTHDCSTLGGNSGSFVMDFSTEEVIGLHFQGSYLKANWAIWLGPLKEFLSEQGVKYD